MTPIFRGHSVLKDVYEVGMDLKVLNGITYPLSTVGVSRGVAFWSSEDESVFDQTVARHGPMLHTIAAHFAAAAEMLGVFPDLGVDDIHLTGREKDCLRLLGLGRTTLQIAEILGVSERTVRFHVTNACQKLGVETRAHAVSRALQLNLVTF